MDNKIPKWVRDLLHTANSVAFGELEAVDIERHRSKVNRVTISKSVNLRPKTPEEGLIDLQNFINSFINAGFSGRVEFAVDFESGTIKMLIIKNKETKHYGQTAR